MNFKDLSVVTKTIIGQIVFLLFALASAVALNVVTTQAINGFTEFRSGIGSASTNLAGARTHMALVSEATLEFLFETEKVEQQRLNAAARASSARFETSIAATAASTRQRSTQLDQIRQGFVSLSEARAELINLRSAGRGADDPEVKAAYRRFAVGAKALDERIADLLNQLTDDEDRQFSDIQDTLHLKQWLIMGSTLLVLGFAAFIMVGVTRRTITSPLCALVDASKRLLSGDLDQTVIGAERRDEIGGMARVVQELKETLISQRKLGQQMLTSSQQVAAATGQAAAAIEQVSDGAQRQLHSVGSIATSLSQTNMIIASIADMSHSAKESAQAAAAKVMSSMQQIQAMTIAVRDIATTSEQINRITQSIGQLATRSNILSLNAAIEAARAGDQGRGFSVVAEEVGNLAQQTGSLAQEIAGLAANSGERIRTGVGVAEEVGALMHDVVTAVGRTDTMSADIARSMEEQQVVLRQIEQSLSGLNTISNANATAGEEISATMIELTRLANNSRQQASTALKGNLS